MFRMLYTPSFFNTELPMGIGFGVYVRVAGDNMGRIRGVMVRAKQNAWTPAQLDKYMDSIKHRFVLPSGVMLTCSQIAVQQGGLYLFVPTSPYMQEVYTGISRFLLNNVDSKERGLTCPDHPVKYTMREIASIGEVTLHRLVHTHNGTWQDKAPIGFVLESPSNNHAHFRTIAQSFVDVGKAGDMLRMVKAYIRGVPDMYCPAGKTASMVPFFNAKGNVCFAVVQHFPNRQDNVIPTMIMDLSGFPQNYDKKAVDGILCAADMTISIPPMPVNCGHRSMEATQTSQEQEQPVAPKEQKLDFDKAVDSVIATLQRRLEHVESLRQRQVDIVSQQRKALDVCEDDDLERVINTWAQNELDKLSVELNNVLKA